LAKEQFSGKGQRGNLWESKSGENLTFSIIYFPSFLTAEKQFMLSKIISVALADFTENTLKKTAYIKWPNDIYVEEKKIAGILIENTLREKNISSSVIGIGLNVNQVDFSSDLPNPSSLKLFSGKNYELKLLLSEVCSFVEGRYLQLKAGKNELIDEDFIKKLYRINQWSNFSAEEKMFRGKIIGTTASGKLIVEKENGEKTDYNFKEIKFTNSSF